MASAGGVSMRAIGIVLLIVGVIVGIVALSMNTTVTTKPETIGGIEIPSQTVNNLGLMDDRRNTLIVSGLVVVVGVILLAVGSLQRASLAASTDGSDTRTRRRANTKKCPYCAEDIMAQAVVCRYCGRDLPTAHETWESSWSEPESLREVPASMAKAYEAWQMSCSEKDFTAFLHAATAARSLLPPGTTAAQLEATFPGIPVDFDAILD